MSVADSGEDDSREPESPKVYAVRFTPQADADMLAAAFHLSDLIGDEEIARQWFLGMREAGSALSTLPRRYPVLASESRRVGVQGVEVRRLLYRRGAAAAAGYHLYFYVTEEGDDGPRVTIFHVRHAARRPMTASEGREFRKDL